jgi:hypothetical protein
MADHRFCLRHLYANFRDAGFRGLALKDKLWAAATAYTEADFRLQMEQLKAINEDAYNWLDKVDPSGWSRAWFNSYSKCDLLVNNISECFNSYILKSCDKPILTMLEMIRKQLMRRYQLKRSGAETLHGKLCPTIVAKLEAIGEESIHCLSTYAGNGLFKVEESNRQYVVDLKRKTCGCRKWEITGIPCSHAFSAILYDRGNPEDYVDDCYSVEKYKKAYEFIVYPMPSEEQWLRTEHEKVEPPKSRLTPGRPKKVRIRAPDEAREPKNPYSARKFGARMRCSNCKLIGHNTRTCPKKKADATNYRKHAVESNASTQLPSSVSMTILNPNVQPIFVNANNL